MSNRRVAFATTVVVLVGCKPSTETVRPHAPAEAEVPAVAEETHDTYSLTATGKGTFENLPTVSRPAPPDASGPAPAAWVNWEEQDEDCLDLRNRVLRERSSAPVKMDYTGCRVERGRWQGAYSAEQFEDANLVDVDHLVSPEVAHNSGGWEWTDEEKEAFATDADNLVIVSAATRQDKHGRAPHEWMPGNPSAQCDYVTRWTQIKTAYGLGFSDEEAKYVAGWLDGCGYMQTAAGQTVARPSPKVANARPPETEAPPPRSGLNVSRAELQGRFQRQFYGGFALVLLGSLALLSGLIMAGVSAADGGGVGDGPNCTVGKRCGDTCIARNLTCNIDDPSGSGGSVNTGLLVAGLVTSLLGVGGLIGGSVLLIRAGETRRELRLSLGPSGLQLKF